MNVEKMNEQFSAEVAPSMVLLDVAGRKNKVFNVCLLYTSDAADE